MSYMCPVCGYPDMEEPPEDFEICDCCGTQFAFHDDVKSHKDLRAEWIGRGAPWFSEVVHAPWGWDVFAQLAQANIIPSLGFRHVARKSPTVFVRATEEMCA